MDKQKIYVLAKRLKEYSDDYENDDATVDMIYWDMLIDPYNTIDYMLDLMERMKA